MPLVKKPKVGAKTATGSEAKNTIARRRNSVAKGAIGRSTSRSPTKKTGKSSEDDGVEEAEEDEPLYEPSEEEMDDDITDGSSLACPLAKAGKGKKGVVKPANKMVYKKHLRRDATKFTTSQAMVDAEEEFDPRAAAYRGKATHGSGNGRKKGRRLIRWTAQADQLLLLCLHHELARNKEELPYEAIAQRMFPEKNATGGAIKERFAKLRIECLNRGSWVPPILGKTPQNTRPDVRGVVRLAPGIDKGRFVLWKEDASKLIDPKDINKGHVDAQKKGLQYPERLWINPGAEKEYLNSMHAHKALNLSPIKGPVPTDDDELLSDGDEENEMEVASDDEGAIPCTPKKRKSTVATPPSKKKSRTFVQATPKKIAAKGKGVKGEDSDYEGTTGITQFSAKKALRASRHKSPTKSSKNSVTTPSVEVTNSRVIRKGESSDESDESDESEDEDISSPVNNRLMMMAFDKDEEVRPLRSIVIVRGITPGALSKYPAGIQGPGDDDYADDEVAEAPAVPRDEDEDESHLDEDDRAATPFNAPADTPFADDRREAGQGGSMFEQYYNVDDLLTAMKLNTEDGEVINHGLWKNHLEQMNALNADVMSSNPSHTESHQQTEIPQYGQIQAQSQFAANGLGPSESYLGVHHVGFGKFNSPPAQGNYLQQNTNSFAKNGLLDDAQYRQTKGVGFNSSGNSKPDPVPAGFSAQDVTLPPGPDDNFFPFDAYDGTGESLFGGDFGPMGPLDGYLKYES